LTPPRHEIEADSARRQVPAFYARPPGWLGSGGLSFEALASWVAHAEALGFDGIFVGDRLLSEATAKGKVVYGASMLEASVTLAAVAARTERVRLGPLVLVFAYRHPLQLAKMVATLDVVSGGRIVLGAGVGWNTREFEALGIDPAGRGRRFEESLDIVRALWRGETVTRTGGAWELHDVRVDPVPVQTGGPPIWLASFSPGDPLEWSGAIPAGVLRVLDRVGRLADGWVPLIYSASGKRRLEAEVLAAAWEEVGSSADRSGRGRDAVDFVFSDWCYVLDSPESAERCRAAVSRFFVGDWDDMVRTYSIGSPERIVEQIEAQTAGVDRVDAYVLTPLSGEVEQLDLLAERVVPALRAARTRADGFS